MAISANFLQLTKVLLIIVIIVREVYRLLEETKINYFYALFEFILMMCDTQIYKLIIINMSALIYSIGLMIYGTFGSFFSLIFMHYLFENY